MLVFIMLSLGLCFIQQFSAFLLTFLVSPIFIYAGLIIAILGIAGIFFEKLSDSVGYDLFSSGTLLLWFAYWKPFFEPDSPIFFFYPLYFALISAFITLFLSNQGHKLDKQSLQYMQYLDRERVIPAWSLMIFILLSLEVRQHYQLFPVLMTLLMLRFAFSSCLPKTPIKTN